MKTTARCCCGSNSIDIEGDIKLNVLCHCSDCKKRTGSAFGHSLYFPLEAIKDNSQELGVYSIENEGGKQKRYFCSDCGSTIYWHWERFNDWIGVAAGCVVDNPPEPSISACHNQKKSWMSIPETWRLY